MSVRYSANEIFQLIKPYPLAEEKIRAIEDAPLESPALVVAGAGSGKTELLTVRVLWLVANGLARPEQILGLTFTKKAAAELSKRIFAALLKLRSSQFWPEEFDKDFTPPLIATYNSFANQIFRENALALGYESESKLLNEAAAFQLAREVCLKYGSEVSGSLSDLDLNLDSIVEKVIELAQALNDHGQSAQGVAEVIHSTIERISSLPQKKNVFDGKRYGYIDELLQGLTPTPLIAELAERFQQEKKRLSAVDYSDQVALAHKAVSQFPSLGKELSERFTQVMLDEYQDTSVLQTKLLSSIYRNRSVFAVGDPNQSIYGWRGASSSNLDDFASDFGSAMVFSLRTSWRNPLAVLGLANQIAKPLATPPSFVTGRSVAERVIPVELAPMPDAVEGKITFRFDQTIEQEVDNLAKWLIPHSKAGKKCAVLMRKRSSMRQVVDGLQRHGLEVEVVGLGGLLELAEIVDLVSALKVIQRTDSGAELIRLLSGARWRIGVRDLERLNRLAHILSGPKQEGVIRQSLSLTEALDAVLETGDELLADFSDLGKARLRDAARLFRNLRSATALPLSDFVRMVAEELWLDIELQANPKLRNPLGHLNAFYEIVSGFSSLSAAAQLGAFLNWLDYAEKRERFEIPKVTPGAGVIQVLTVHAAKGLEWECVAIPNLVEDDFPSKPRSTSGWLTGAELPFELRGDFECLPKFDIENTQLQVDVKQARDDFKSANREYQLREEYRLIYVAITRSMSDLYLSASYWKPANSQPRKPSRFFEQLLPADFLFPELESQLNPLDAEPKTALWPLDPLGEQHRARLISAAQQVEQSAELASKEQLPEGRISEQLEILLREQEERMANLTLVPLPVRIPASRFKEFVRDPSEQAERYLRPLPQQPYRATLQGTYFHLWVEDFLVQQVDNEVPIGIADLTEIFKGSRFDPKDCIEVELEINLTRGQNTFVCKLDAVFSKGNRVEIVDWKTGAAPKTEKESREMTMQLALYRFAYSLLTGKALEDIDVCFYFVAENKELVPKDVPNPDQLMSIWSKLFD